METERDKDRQTERQGEKIIGGGGGVAAALAPPIAPLDLVTPPEIPPLLLQRLSITELRRFSDSSSCILLPLPFLLEKDFSLAVAAVAGGAI